MAPVTWVVESASSQVHQRRLTGDEPETCAPVPPAVKQLEPQGNAEGRFWELRNEMKELRQYFTREIETLKKNQTNSEVKSIEEMKNSLERIGS